MIYNRKKNQNMGTWNGRINIFLNMLISVIYNITYYVSISHVQLFVSPWTVAHQDPPSMGFSRQKYWSGLPFLSPVEYS